MHTIVMPSPVREATTLPFFRIPLPGSALSPEACHELWVEMKSYLPRFQVMPTAVGFCMLIKAVVLDRFGLFDESYSPGYNEENDFVCRINRYGYSAVSANHAFVSTTRVRHSAIAKTRLNKEIGVSFWIATPNTNGVWLTTCSMK